MNPILIEIKQTKPGFNSFINSWVCKGDPNIVIDVGPANSANHLVESLRAMDMDRVDYILITHIHLDHAGGLAYFLEQYPMATVIVHAKGVKHLIDPSKLWAGSRKALGETAEFYGELKPVKQERLIPHTEAVLNNLEIIETPGHAPHHLSFCYQGALFAGEACGNYFAFHGQEYMRPATPPIFFLEECLTSVERLLAVEDQPMCYAHFGSVESSHRSLRKSRDQLLRWENIIKEVMSEGQPHLLKRCEERLLEKDPDLRAFWAMAPDFQERERFFLANSIRGYTGFLERGLKTNGLT